MKRILIVEDDSDISDILRDYLHNKGFSVECAENGSVGLELIEKNGLPDVILLDMKMPVVNGWQFAAKLNENYDHHTPIVVMTAAGDGEQRAKDVEASGWIPKPFSLKDMFSMVQRISGLRTV